MTKNWNQKKKNGIATMAMDITEHCTTMDLPQAMDTSESAAPLRASGSQTSRKTKKGVQMKRAKNARKMKAIAKAISQSEKFSEKATKYESKKVRVKSAKSLYD